MTRQSFFPACLALAFKRLRKRLFALLAMAIAALLLGAAAARAGQAVLNGPGFGGIHFAVASAEENPTLDGMLGQVAAHPALREYVSLRQVPYDQAEQMVYSGQVHAALLLPQGWFSSVMQGGNLPPVLLVDTARPLELMLIMLLADSAAGMLTAAQQGDALVFEVWNQAEPADRPDAATVTADINARFILWVLGQRTMYEDRQISATGALEVPAHYLLSALLYLSLLATAVLAGFYSLRQQGPFLVRLRSAGRSLGSWAGAHLLAGGAAMAAFLLVLLAGAALALGQRPGAAAIAATLPGFLLAVVCLTGFGFLLANAGGVLASISLNFLLATALLVTAGGLLPVVLLPAPLAALAPYSPLGWMRGALAPLLGYPLSPAALLPLAALALVLLAACFVYVRAAGRSARYAR